MRVGFYMFFPGGGIGRYTNELVCALARLPDVDAEVICTPDFAWNNTEAYRTWAGLRSISHRSALRRKARFLTGQFANPVRAIRHARAVGLDVLHFSNINHLSFPYWRRPLEAAGLPYVASVHDVRRQTAILNRSWEERQLKAFYRSAHALFVHSEHQVDDLVAFAGVARDRIHIVPHGLYPHGDPLVTKVEARHKLGLPDGGAVALFFGQLRDEKNLDQLLRALATGGAECRLVVAGVGGGRHRDVAYYRSLAQTQNLADRVVFLDRYIHEEEVGLLFTASDWVALPYDRSFTSQSGVLNVAVHYERPVLVTMAPVLRETVQRYDVGVACAGDTVDDLAAGIGRLSRQVREGYSFGFSAFRTSCSWDENARRTRQVYEQLVGG